MVLAVRERLSDLLSYEAWRSTFAEFIATMLFVFVGAGSVVVTGSLTDGELTAARLIAIAMGHGLAITLLVYATANLSGGHINPAVTFAAALTRKISTTKGAMYIGAQLTGAATGALLLKLSLPDLLEGNLGAHTLGPDVTITMGILMEIVLTFVLVFVIFATAFDPEGMGRLAPLAIGLTVLVGHIVAVPLTGASMNPARSFGPAVVEGVWGNHWVYWAGPVIGGAIASLVYQVVFLGRPIAGRPTPLELPRLDTKLTQDRVELSEVDLFRDLTDDQIERVASVGKRSDIAAGQVLGKASEVGGFLFIVLAGKAEASVQSPIGAVTVRIVGPGESFPVAALLGSGALVTSVKATTVMDVLAIPRAKLLALCSEDPEIGMRLYAVVAEVSVNRYRETLAKVGAASQQLQSELLELESRSLWPF